MDLSSHSFLCIWIRFPFPDVAMRETNLAMERELNNLKEENERIANENEKLEESVSG